MSWVWDPEPLEYNIKIIVAKKLFLKSTKHKYKKYLSLLNLQKYTNSFTPNIIYVTFFLITPIAPKMYETFFFTIF